EKMGKEIGLIGLGIMGKGMGVNVLKGGDSVSVLDIDTEGVVGLKEVGGNGGGSAGEGGCERDMMMRMVGKGEDVEGVVGGEEGILGRGKGGRIIIDMRCI
ncbi:NAD(P)-binding domain-containing protein, partial [Bacillus altitudinis]|uniref:NAD(P)-binding domain-containing protein n=1 Tax=Bacillus altitudinis TaxID=293387 RepID=UPI001F327753